MTRTRYLIYALPILTAVLPAMAAVEPPGSAIRDKALRHPGLSIRHQYVPAAEAHAYGWSGVPADLEALGAASRGAYFDVRGRRWGTLMPTQPLLPGSGVGNRLRWPGQEAPQNPDDLKRLAWSAFATYLENHERVLAIDVDELTQPVITRHHGGDLIQIYAPRIVDAIPVRDSYVTAVISHGNLILMGAHNWGDVTVAPTPSLAADAARATLETHLGPFAAGASWGKSSLALVPTSAPDRYVYRLVWVWTGSIAGDGGRWEAMVDAHSGELLKLEDIHHYASTRGVVGGVLPFSNDGLPPDGIEQAGWPMPFTDLVVESTGETAFTDAGGGLLACVDGTVTSTLDGRFVSIRDSCGDISLSSDGELLDFGTSDGTNCTTPGVGGPGNTHAARTAFYELGRISSQARALLPDNEWLRKPLGANTNLNFNCGAMWTGSTVNFYRSGSGCPNTGEIASILDHEWGHGMDDNDALPNISNPSEGIADVYAALRLDNSCIARGFRPVNCGGYGDPCTDCLGIRDIDWAKRTSGLPHDLGSPFPSGIDALCGSGNGTPCGGTSHCEGAVYAEAIWDLLYRDLTAEPFNFSVDAARELVTQLTYVGGGAVGDWFQCTPPFGGCNADGGYLNFLAADDDDGDLTNGTPHMSAIFAAFDRHQIACGTPTVIDSGCEPAITAAPTLTAEPLDRGALLSWNAVPEATAYNVYRGEGVHECDWGKELIATTSDTSFADSGLLNGFEYYYLVIPIGPGATCFGPASSCTAVTPEAAPNLALDAAASGGFSFDVSDGDVFLDNCEQGEVTIALANVGTGSQTNVRITDVRPSHAATIVTTSFPVVVAADLAACDTAGAAIGLVAGGLVLGDVVDLEVDFTSDQLAPLTRTQTLRIAVPGTESDLQSLAAKTFSFEADLDGWRLEQGTFDRDDTGGGDGTTWFLASSDGAHLQCDRIRSPLIVLSPSSTLELWNNYDIEPQSSGSWYDRANVGLIDLAGDRALISPDGGRLYNANSDGPGNYQGCNEPEEGWAGTEDTWGTSTWTAQALEAPVFAGDFVRLEVIYGTDPALANRGFWFDQVTLTDLDLQVEDSQSNVCETEIFADGFESGDTSAWSTTVPP